MKKFVTLIITAFIISVAASFTAKAQYVSDSTEQSAMIQRIKIGLYDLPQYQEAKEDVRSGKTLFFVGLGCAAVGGAIVGSAPALAEREGYRSIYDGNHEYQSGESDVALIGGSLIAATGIVLNIVGISKWAQGAATIRELKFAYMFSGNGLVISF